MFQRKKKLNKDRMIYQNWSGREMEEFVWNTPMRSVAGCDLQPATHGCRVTAPWQGKRSRPGSAHEFAFAPQSTALTSCAGSCIVYMLAFLASLTFWGRKVAPQLSITQEKDLFHISAVFYNFAIFILENLFCSFKTK